jgi:hypothetical protein
VSRCAGAEESKAIPALFSYPQRLPRWAAPFGLRYFAPALPIALLAFNLGVVTLKWLQRPAGASGLLWLWIPGVIGAVLLCAGWRALMRNGGGAPLRARP